MAEVNLVGLLQALGLTGPQRALSVGAIIGRTGGPGLGAGDPPLAGRTQWAGGVAGPRLRGPAPGAVLPGGGRVDAPPCGDRAAALCAGKQRFALEWTVTLYDLSNPCFEGEAAGNPKSQRGHSKEKRRDCPLVTLGLVLDGSGLVRRSQTFDGNGVKGTTLEDLLHRLGAPRGALVVMDAGMATEENIVWLRTQGYCSVTITH